MPPRRARNTNNENPEEPPNLAQLMQLLHQQSITLAQQQQLLQQLQQQQQAPPPPTTFKSFQAVKPPEFRGTQDPVEAQSWLKEMEKAFTLDVVTDEKKVEYAS